MDTLTAAIFRVLLTEDGWNRYGSYIDTRNGFKGTNFAAIFAAIKELQEKGGGDFTSQDLDLYFAAGVKPKDDERYDELSTLVGLIGKSPEVHIDAFDSSIRRYLVREYSIQAAEDIAQSQHKDNFDPSVAYDLLERAVEVGRIVDESVDDFFDLGLPGDGDGRLDTRGTGLSAELDAQLRGGIARNELLLIFAPPSRGKTSALVAIGASLMSEGCKVLHVTLEIDTNKVKRRYESALSGLDEDQLLEHPEAAVRVREEVAAVGGRLWIKDWSYKNSTPSDVEALVARIESKHRIKIDTVIIDYGELLMPDIPPHAKRAEMRHMYGFVIYQLRAMAKKLELRCITAWQGNRNAWKVESLTPENMSESWEPVKHADIILALNQNTLESQHNRMRIGILKQRESKMRGEYWVHANMDTNQWREMFDPQEGTTVEEDKVEEI